MTLRPLPQRTQQARWLSEEAEATVWGHSALGSQGHLLYSSEDTANGRQQYSSPTREPPLKPNLAIALLLQAARSRSPECSHRLEQSRGSLAVGDMGLDFESWAFSFPFF